MPQPTAYSKTTNFAQDEANNVGGRSTVLASRVDAELSNIETTLDQTLGNLALIQRDDGKLRDSIVEVYHLSPSARVTVGLDIVPRGAWVQDRAYAANDLVEQDGASYVCVSAHTSVDFAGDHLASKWLLLAGNGGVFQQSGSGSVIRTAQDKARERVSPEDFSAVGNGIADDTIAINKAITAASGGVLELTPGRTYQVSTLSLATIAGLHIIGNGALLRSNQDIILQATADCANLTFEGVKFASTSAAGTVFGLFTSIGFTLTNIRFLGCDFTAPACTTDGIKIDVGTAGKTITGLLVSGCKFNSLGQMGVEVINHLLDGVQRIFGVRIIGNEFNGTGQTSTFGQAVSLSGEGAGITVANNTVSDAKSIALEFVGGQTDLAVQGNTIRNCKANCSSIFVGKGTAVNAPARVSITSNTIYGADGGFFQPTQITQGVISGNVVYGGTHKVSIEVLTGVALTGNTFEVSKDILFLTLVSCAITGNRFRSLLDVAGNEPTMTNCTDCSVTGNTFRSARQNGLALRGTSSYNVLTGNIFDNTDCTGPVSALVFDGASVTNNAAFGNVMKVSAAGGFTYAQTNGATGNQTSGTIASRINFSSTDQIPASLTLAAGSVGWAQPVRIGSGYVWVDAAGRLRIKASLPTLDTDGTVVGTQT